MQIPLEDNFNDIVGKAMRGLGLDDASAAAQAGLIAGLVQQFREGEEDTDTTRKKPQPSDGEQIPVVEICEPMDVPFSYPIHASPKCRPFPSSFGPASRSHGNGGRCDSR